jgi:hypothetical protein
MFGTNYNAGGFESYIQTMRAKSAFRGGVGFRVEIDRVIGTGLHAGFTSDANARVKFDDAIITLIHRSHGTDAHTRRVGAMITARHLKAAAHIGIRARFNILDPRAIYTKWHLILRLARGTARVTSDTFALVNEEAVIGHELPTKG